MQGRRSSGTEVLGGEGLRAPVDERPASTPGVPKPIKDGPPVMLDPSKPTPMPPAEELEDTVPGDVPDDD
jgi:hypothetical protein